MATINSVLGPIDTADLGFTLSHEHLLVDPYGYFSDYPELFGPNARERIINDLIRAKEAGIDTVVDATTCDLGRDIELLREASFKSKVNIIATTGWHLNIPYFFARISADKMAEWFVREIEEGIAGTDIKAGVLKGASDIYGVTPETELILRILARANIKTGVPIALHSFPRGQVGRQQVAILMEEGVNLKRVKIDHSNDTTDVGYLVWLLEQGVYLGLDRYPGEDVSPLDRTITLKALIDAGYAEHLCLSHDLLMSHIQVDSPEVTEQERQGINPHGLLYVKNEVIPKLQEMGVPSEVLQGLCVNGPRNFFEGR